MKKGNQKVMLGGPVDTIVMAPSLVGFTPKNSLVIFSVDENDYVEDVKCITLGSAVKENADDYESILSTMQNKAFVLAFFVDDHTIWAQMGSDFMDLDFWFQDIIFFNKELKWGSYICQDELCCPVEGKSLTDNRVLAGA
jgi:hypothetical protein